MSKTVIITGSSGLVGSALVSYFSKLGFRVRAFQRGAPGRNNSAVEYYPFDLADVQDNGFAGADYLIHCAYRPVVSRKERLGMNVDLEGTKKIIALARKYSIKMIFLSTSSAHLAAQSYYAKNKLLAEGLFDPAQDLVLKLGIVLGNGGGLFGKIASSLKKYKVVPLIGGQQLTQTIALDDLCRIIEAGINKNITGSFIIAHSRTLSTQELYQKIAGSIGVKPFFIPVPWVVAYRLAQLAEKIGLKLPFTAENILGLNDLKTFDTSNNLAVFGVAVKDCQTTLEHLYARSV